MQATTLEKVKLHLPTNMLLWEGETIIEHLAISHQAIKGFAFVIISCVSKDITMVSKILGWEQLKPQSHLCRKHVQTFNLSWLSYS